MFSKNGERLCAFVCSLCFSYKKGKDLKFYLSAIIVFLVLAEIIPINNINEIYAQGLTIEDIKTNLWYNPPNVGDSTMREQTIIALDDILKISYPGPSDSDIMDFYALMMKKVKS